MIRMRLVVVCDECENRITGGENDTVESLTFEAKEMGWRISDLTGFTQCQRCFAGENRRLRGSLKKMAKINSERL